MPSSRVPLTVVATSDVARRQLAGELASTALDLRDPDAADAVTDLVAAVHGLLESPSRVRA